LGLDGVGAEAGLTAAFLEAGAIALGAGDLDLVDLLCLTGSSITFLATTGLVLATGCECYCLTGLLLLDLLALFMRTSSLDLVRDLPYLKEGALL